ncbi:MAG: IS66 family insertion sequence element accessory protein TnpB [Acidithiobacillus sp.]
MLRADPFNGQAFLFRNRRGDRFKILWWDGWGFWLWSRQLERGRWCWPKAGGGGMEMTATRWALLPEGRPRKPLAPRKKIRPTLF